MAVDPVRRPGRHAPGAELREARVRDARLERVFRALSLLLGERRFQKGIRTRVTMRAPLAGAAIVIAAALPLKARNRRACGAMKDAIKEESPLEVRGEGRRRCSLAAAGNCLQVRMARSSWPCVVFFRS